MIILRNNVNLRLPFIIYTFLSHILAEKLNFFPQKDIHSYSFCNKNLVSNETIGCHPTTSEGLIFEFNLKENSFEESLMKLVSYCGNKEFSILFDVETEIVPLINIDYFTEDLLMEISDIYEKYHKNFKSIIFYYPENSMGLKPGKEKNKIIKRFFPFSIFLTHGNTSTNLRALAEENMRDVKTLLTPMQFIHASLVGENTIYKYKESIEENNLKNEKIFDKIKEDEEFAYEIDIELNEVDSDENIYKSCLKESNCFKFKTYTFIHLPYSFDTVMLNYYKLLGREEIYNSLTYVRKETESNNEIDKNEEKKTKNKYNNEFLGRDRNIYSRYNEINIGNREESSNTIHFRNINIYKEKESSDQNSKSITKEDNNNNKEKKFSDIERLYKFKSNKILSFFRKVEDFNNIIEAKYDKWGLFTFIKFDKKDIVDKYEKDYININNNEKENLEENKKNDKSQKKEIDTEDSKTILIYSDFDFFSSFYNMVEIPVESRLINILVIYQILSDIERKRKEIVNSFINSSLTYEDYRKGKFFEYNEKLNKEKSNFEKVFKADENFKIVFSLGGNSDIQKFGSSYFFKPLEAFKCYKRRKMFVYYRTCGYKKVTDYSKELESIEGVKYSFVLNLGNLQNIFLNSSFSSYNNNENEIENESEKDFEDKNKITSETNEMAKSKNEDKNIKNNKNETPKEKKNKEKNMKIYLEHGTIDKEFKRKVKIEKLSELKERFRDVKNRYPHLNWIDDFLEFISDLGLKEKLEKNPKSNFSEILDFVFENLEINEKIRFKKSENLRKYFGKVLFQKLEKEFHFNENDEKKKTSNFEINKYLKKKIQFEEISTSLNSENDNLHIFRSENLFNNIISFDGELSIHSSYTENSDPITFHSAADSLYYKDLNMKKLCSFTRSISNSLLKLKFQNVENEFKERGIEVEYSSAQNCLEMENFYSEIRKKICS